MFFVFLITDFPLKQPFLQSGVEEDLERNVTEAYNFNQSCMHDNPLVFNDSMMWFKEGDGTVSNNSILFFQQVHRNDSGTYYCILGRGSPQGEGSVMLNLTVLCKFVIDMCFNTLHCVIM